MCHRVGYNSGAGYRRAHGGEGPRPLHIQNILYLISINGSLSIPTSELPNFIIQSA